MSVVIDMWFHFLFGGFGIEVCVLSTERLVDIDQDLLLPLPESVVGQDRGGDARIADAGFQDPGADVELFGRDTKPFGDLLQDVRAGLAKAPFDLREVRVRYAGEPSELSE